MDYSSFYGINRALEPKLSPPYTAWRLDNTMELASTELLVDVHFLYINHVSFKELLEETELDEEKFVDRILEIVKQRGKLHNPVTGTGGTLVGRVLEIGKDYPNYYHVSPGDTIITLASLSLIPLQIKRVLSVDYENAQIEVEGLGILSALLPLVKQPDDLPLNIVAAAMDEAGVPTRTFQIVKEDQRVLIIGADSKAGALSAHAAKDRLNGTGTLVGIVKTPDDYRRLSASGLFDEIICADAAHLDTFVKATPLQQILDQFEVVINCSNSPGTELITMMSIKHRGIIYFATLSSDYKHTALCMEGLGKEALIIPYSGYLEGHAEYAFSLLRRFPFLRATLSQQQLTRPITKKNYYTSEETSIQDDGYVFNSEQSRKALTEAMKVAPYNSNVLIYGESGVGKEIIARIIHQNSLRKSFPLVKINCAAIPENLLESELFGYEQGAFTGANKTGKMGLWEAAQNGTLFLDEVGELPLSFQAKLLRVIQEKEIVRVGGTTPIRVDVRIVAATNRDLREMVRLQLFREDLYYRLNVYPITVPPLRKRKDDIIPLVYFFISKYNKEFEMSKTISQEALHFLFNQPFMGNIREMQNLIQRVMITTDHTMIMVKDILHAMAYDEKATSDRSASNSTQAQDSIAKTSSLKAILERTEASVFREYQQRYGSTRKIAKALQISQPTVVRKLHQYGLLNHDA